MIDLDQLQLFGVPLMVLIVALVQAAKALGMDVKYAPWLTGVLAVLGYGAIQYVEFNPAAAPWVEYAVNSIYLFLSASGLYAVGKFTVERLSR